MIRRRKAEVLRQLPSRTDQTLLVPMTAEQMVIHQENADIVAQIVQRWRRTKFLSDTDQRRLTCALQNMRMSCNSTWLLDRETDHGVKADELAALLDGILVQPAAKIVVFSQWTRTHDIVIRRLEGRGIGYVSFHGGIAAHKRAALVQRFHDEPDCRVFLSTDAGAAGLNLQNASTLVNMDLPWNPAILEQRSGRIHRIGQKRPIQIINFVAKGTIEEGMLAVLAFKRSLSAGVLDGGQSEIALGGSRLSRFIKDVESVTGQMGVGEAIAPAEESSGQAAAAASEGDQPRTHGAHDSSPQAGLAAPTAVASGAPADPWAMLVEVGSQLIAALSTPDEHETVSHPWIERDSVTGARSLKVPLPPPATTRRLADALSTLAEALRRSGGRD